MVSSTGLFVFLCIIAIVLAGPPEGYKRYDNHKLVLLTVTEVEDYYFLEDQYSNNQSLDFWIEPRIGEVVVRVGPEDYYSFTTMIAKRGIKFEKINDNIQEQLDETWEEIGDRYTGEGEGSADAFALNQYNTLADIHAWMRSLPSQYSDSGLTIQPFVIGNSYQGRELLAIRITNPNTPGPKNTVMFDGGIHAREWISPATVCWMLNAILDNYTNHDDPEIRTIVDSLNIIVMPVYNPDGYAYTFSNDRLWRKTRRPNSGSTCVGTDPNRNWNDHWMQAGTSTNPCAENYGGPNANSEREVQQVSAYLDSLYPNCKGYINFHAYSQLWLSPYGWTSTLPPQNADLLAVGRNAAAALRSWFNTAYTVGPIYTTIYPASGSSADYAYSQSVIKYSYAPELRPTSSSGSGFQLPANQIIPSGLETYEALRVWLNACKDE